MPVYSGPVSCPMVYDSSSDSPKHVWPYPSGIQGSKKKKKDFLFPDDRLEMASDRWAVQQYQYSYYPYDPYYSYSHACARNCSYFATTTLASRYSPRSTEQPPCTPSSRVVSMRWSRQVICRKKKKYHLITSR